MSLTLLPITALLLLLSGVGTPAHAAGYAAGCAETVAALRKGLLRSLDVSALPSRNGVRKCVTGRRAPDVSFALLRADRPETQVPCGLSGNVRPGDRKQYHTRFGFAEGAYLAIGPPARRPAADLG